MVTGSLPIHYLCKQQLLQGVAVSKDTPLPQAGSEGWNVVPASHRNLVQRLSVSPLDVLDHHIAMDEVGPYPGRVEGSPTVIQEHHTHYVISYVALLVHLEDQK